MLPPEFKPNFVPLSYKRLNSTYLPRLIYCFSLSFFVHFVLIFLLIKRLEMLIIAAAAGIITLLLNILIKPLALFGIDAVVQNRVGPYDYGTYFSLLNLSILFNIVLDIGINNYTTKKVAQDPQKASDYFGKVMVLRFVLFIVYTFFTLSIGYVIGYGEKQFLMLAFLMFNQLLIMIIQFSRSYFSGFHLFLLSVRLLI